MVKKYCLCIVVIKSLFIGYVYCRSASKNNVSNLNCALPEQPTHGHYTVAGSTSGHSPGDIVSPYTILQYSCDEGYFATNNVTYCHRGQWAVTAECQKRKVLCYMPNWATYRSGQGKFDVEDIDTNLCTHLVFAFVGITEDQNIRVKDKWNDLYDDYGKGAIARFVKLRDKNPNLKILVAVGGWSEGSKKFSESLNTTSKRETFVQNSVDFILQHGFDGLEIDWEFPTINGGSQSDKEDFSELIKVFREAFDPRGLILSAVVAAPEYYMMSAYDTKVIGTYLDIINVKAYDFHGAWEPVLGIRSPLFAASDEIGKESQGLNVNSAITAWINYGAPPHKIVLGIGLFGRSFNVSSPSCKLPRCPSAGSGAPGQWTAEPGSMGYNEICLLEKDSAALLNYDTEAMAPFLVKDNMWVSYDNIKSIEQKVNYILYNNLGGASLWSLDTDDFKGQCGDRFPLTSYVHRTILAGVPTGPMPVPPTQQTKRTKAVRSSERVLVCYYASWSVYRNGDGKMDVEDINPNLCTHLVYAFVSLSDDIGIKVRDPWNDLYDNYGRGALTRFAKLKDINPNLVVLLALGGYGEPSERFSQMWDTPEKRNVFVQNSKTFLLKYGFDGLDLDWEFPAQRGGSPVDKENFASMVRDLKMEYEKHNLLVTALVASTQYPLATSYDFKTLGKHLDLINLKSFDMHGFWDQEVGHNSPLFGNRNDLRTIDRAVKEWTSNGVPSNKLVMGLAAYGRSFTLSSKTCVSPRCLSKGAGNPGNFTTDGGMLGFNEICLLEREVGATLSFDTTAKVPYLHKDDQWISYENKKSIQHKVDYIIANNLGGAMVYTLDTDDFRGACGEGNYPLLTALSNSLIKEETTNGTGTPLSDPATDVQPTQEPTTDKIPTESNERGCPLPEMPANGRYEVGSDTNLVAVPGSIVPPYTLLAYSCKKKFVPSREIAYCRDDFTWSFDVVCNRRCRMPKSFTVDYTCWDQNQNQINCSNYVPSGTIVKYQCKHYHQNANFYNYHMTCEDGRFDFPPPICVPECGAEPSEGQAYIIEGQAAKKSDFPWHVAVYLNRGDEKKPDYQQICGGSLVTSHLVISAAHCFYVSSLRKTNPPSKYAIAVGKFYRNWTDTEDDTNPFLQKSKVKNIYIPLTYSGEEQSHQSDLAIVELVTPIRLSDAIHPVCLNLNNDELNRHHLRSNNLGKVAGWGLTSEGGSSSDTLQFLNVPVIDYTECKEELRKHNFGKYLTLDKICAGYKNGSAVCRGDSGGGLVFSHRDLSSSEDKWYLRGVVSVGPRNHGDSCRRDTYTAYTQVHYFKDWIASKFVELKV